MKAASPLHCMLRTAQGVVAVAGGNTRTINFATDCLNRAVAVCAGTDVVHLLRDYVLVSAAELGHEPQLREGGFELALTYPRRVLAPACDASELQSQQLGTQATFAVTVIRDASGAEATSAA